MSILGLVQKLEKNESLDTRGETIITITIYFINKISDSNKEAKKVALLQTPWNLLNNKATLDSPFV